MQAETPLWKKKVWTRIQSILNSQIALALVAALFIILAWYLWQNWGRAYLVAVGLIGIVAGSFLFSFPVLGVSIAIFGIVSNVVEFVPGLTSPLLLVTLGIIIVRKLLAGDTQWTVTPVMKWGLLFLLIHMLSTLWADSYRFFEWSLFYRAAFILIIANEVVKKPQDFLIILIGAQAGTILTGILTVQGAAEFYLSGAAAQIAGAVSDIENSRFFGIWFEPNSMALTQVPVIALSLVLVRTTNLPFWIRLSSFIAVGAGLVTVLLSLSRGAMLCTVAVLIMIALADKYRYQIISGVILLAVIVISVLPVDIIGRMASLAEPKADSSIGQRSALILGGIEMIEDSFPLGVGATNYRLYSMDYANRLTRGLIAHNTYIDVFAEAGLAGITAFLGALFVIYRSLKWRARKLIPNDLGANLNVGLGAAVVAITMAMMFLSASGYICFWLFFALAGVLPVVYSDKADGNSSGSVPVY